MNIFLGVCVPKNCWYVFSPTGSFFEVAVRVSQPSKNISAFKKNIPQFSKNIPVGYKNIPASACLYRSTHINVLDPLALSLFRLRLREFVSKKVSYLTTPRAENMGSILEPTLTRQLPNITSLTISKVFVQID